MYYDSRAYQVIVLSLLLLCRAFEASNAIDFGAFFLGCKTVPCRYHVSWPARDALPEGGFPNGHSAYAWDVEVYRSLSTGKSGRTSPHSLLSHPKKYCVSRLPGAPTSF